MSFLWRNTNEIQTVCRHGTREEVIELLLSKPGALAESYRGHYLLHDAAEYNNVPVLDELLARGADINVTTPSLRTALSIAATKGHEEIIQKLMVYGADPFIKDVSNRTARMTANSQMQIFSKSSCIETLFKYEFRYACLRGMVAELKELLVEDPEKGRLLLEQGLNLGASYGKLKVVELMLLEGARNIIDNVTCASRNGHILTASFLMLSSHCFALDSVAVQNLTSEGVIKEHGIDVDGTFIGVSILSDTSTELFFDRTFDLKSPIKLALEGRGSMNGTDEEADLCIFYLLQTKHDPNTFTLSWEGLGLTYLAEAWLCGWDGVTVLDISHNQIGPVLPTSISQLRSLQKFSCNNNALRDLPSSLFELPTLSYLNASSNSIERLQLKGTISQSLKNLNLTNNLLTSLPEHIRESSIQTLRLSKNLFDVFPLCICSIDGLLHLEIDKCKFSDIPNELGRLEELQHLEVPRSSRLDSVLSELPRTEQILAHLKEKLYSLRPLYEMKMVVVGRGGRGKTTLIKRLQKDYTSNKNISTVGIQISKLKLHGESSDGLRRQLGVGGRTLTFHTWDFGGQEEYYATHQCFITPATLYLLVFSLNSGDAGIDELRVWLGNICARAAGSTVLIIGTYLDKVSETECRRMLKEVSERVTLWGFGNQTTVLVPLITAVSCEADTEYRKTVEKLGEAIILKAEKVLYKNKPVLGQLVPNSYVSLMDELTKLKSSYDKEHKIPVVQEQELWRIIRSNGNCDDIDSEYQFGAVTDIMHNLGVILHFKEPSLQHQYFLDPCWLCSMMSQIVTIREKNPFVTCGILEQRKVRHMLKDNKRFPESMFPQYLRILNRFEIALKIDTDRILIPSRLPDTDITPTIPPDLEYFERQISFKNLPSGFIPRVLVSTLSYILSVSGELCSPRFDRNRQFSDSTVFESDGVGRAAITRKRSNALSLRRRQGTPEGLPFGRSFSEYSFGSQNSQTSENDRIEDEAPLSPRLELPSDGDGDDNHGDGDDNHGDGDDNHGDGDDNHGDGDDNHGDGDDNHGDGDDNLGDGDDNHGDSNQGGDIQGDGDNNQCDDIQGDGDNLDILLDLVTPHDVTPVNPNNGPALRDGSLDMDDIIFDEEGEGSVSCTPESLRLESSPVHYELLSDKYLKIWRRGLSFTHSNLHVYIYPYNQENREGLVFVVSRGYMGRRALCHIIDTISMLMEDWYFGLTSGFAENQVLQRIPCPECHEHTFTYDECLTELSDSDDISCPNHPDSLVKLANLIPDIYLSDLEKDSLHSYKDIEFTQTAESRLGDGGFGSVYKGFLRGKPVAVKTFNSLPMTPEAPYLELRREVNILKKMDNVCIVKMLAISIRPRQCLVIEYAPHADLECQLKSEGALSRLFLYKAIHQTACALAYLHKHRVIYRDIKPSNILVFSLSVNVTPNVKLSDYGIAGVLGVGGVKGFAGTPGFQAPEMLAYQGLEEYTEAVDVYSFAFLIYEGLCRRKAYQGLHRFDINKSVMANIRPEGYKSIRMARFGMRNLKKLMEECWSHNPEQRPKMTNVGKMLCHIGYQMSMGHTMHPNAFCARANNACFSTATQTLWIGSSDSDTKSVKIMLLKGSTLDVQMLIDSDFDRSCSTIRNIVEHKDRMVILVQSRYATKLFRYFNVEEPEFETMSECLDYGDRHQHVQLCLTSTDHYLFIGHCHGLITRIAVNELCEVVKGFNTPSDHDIITILQYKSSKSKTETEEVTEPKKGTINKLMGLTKTESIPIVTLVALTRHELFIIQSDFNGLKQFTYSSDLVDDIHAVISRDKVFSTSINSTYIQVFSLKKERPSRHGIDLTSSGVQKEVDYKDIRCTSLAATKEVLWVGTNQGAVLLFSTKHPHPFLTYIRPCVGEIQALLPYSPDHNLLGQPRQASPGAPSSRAHRFLSQHTPGLTPPHRSLSQHLPGVTPPDHLPHSHSLPVIRGGGGDPLNRHDQYNPHYTAGTFVLVCGKGGFVECNHGLADTPHTDLGDNPDGLYFFVMEQPPVPHIEASKRIYEAGGLL